MDDLWRTDSEEEEFEGFRVSAQERENYRRRTRKRRAAVALGEDTDDESKDLEDGGECDDEAEDEEMETEGEYTEGDDETEDDDEQSDPGEEGDDAHASDSSISSLGSSVGGSKDQCPICLMTLKGQQLGKPDNCQHIFCLECIQEWAKNVNTCPVDRKTFNQIYVYNSKKGPVVSMITVEDRQAEEEFEEDDPTFCQVCNQCDREDVLLLCDGCDQGYHLDCMTPPLYHVPIDEWFCNQCRQDDATEHVDEPVVTSRQTRAEGRSRGTRSRPRGRRAGVTSGGATAGPSSGSLSGEGSTARARTVASVRRRGTTRGRARGRGRGRRGRGRTRTSSRTRGGTRKRKRRRKRKTKAGTSTSTGKKVTKRRKYKRTRKIKGKRRKVNRGGPGDEVEPRQAGLKGTVRERLRGSIQTNASSSSWDLGRTLGKCAFPSRLEPTLSFAIFGNDLSLETPPELPEYETGSRVKQESESKRSQANNPDVLGSIFEGLEALHSRSTSIIREGDVVRRELGRKKSDETGKNGQTSQTSNVKLERDDVNTEVEFKPPGMTHTDKKDNGREATKSGCGVGKADEESKIKSTMEKENTAIQSLVGKSLSAHSERFRDKEAKSKERQLVCFSAIKESSSQPSKFRLSEECKETQQDNLTLLSTSSIKSAKNNLEKLSTLCPPRKQTRFSDAAPPISSPQLRAKLSSYKIPRKSSLDFSPVKLETEPTASGCVTAGTGTSKWPESSQLGEDSRQDLDPGLFVTRAGTSSPPYGTSPAKLGRSNDWLKEGPSVSSWSSRDKSTFGPVLKKDSDGRSISVPGEGLSYPCSVKQDNIPSSSPMKVVLKPANSVCSPVVKSSVVTKRTVHFSPNSEPSRHVLDGGSHKADEYRARAGVNAISETDVRKKQNLDIINTLKNKTLDMRARLLKDIRTGESSVTSTGKTPVDTSLPRKATEGCNVENGNITGACSYKGNAVQAHARASPLPVAVVKPTHQVCNALRQSATVSGGNREKNRKEPHKEEESEREKRRVQGIARLQRVAQITDEVKLALKPFYRYGEVNKNEYKDIFRRAVDKIKTSSSGIDRERVTSLVKKYVKHLKGQRPGDS